MWPITRRIPYIARCVSSHRQEAYTPAEVASRRLHPRYEMVCFIFMPHKLWPICISAHPIFCLHLHSKSCIHERLHLPTVRLLPGTSGPMHRTQLQADIRRLQHLRPRRCPDAERLSPIGHGSPVFQPPGQDAVRGLPAARRHIQYSARTDVPISVPPLWTSP